MRSITQHWSSQGPWAQQQQRSTTASGVGGGRGAQAVKRSSKRSSLERGSCKATHLAQACLHGCWVAVSGRKSPALLGCMGHKKVRAHSSWSKEGHTGVSIAAQRMCCQAAGQRGCLGGGETRVTQYQGCMAACICPEAGGRWDAWPLRVQACLPLPSLFRSLSREQWGPFIVRRPVGGRVQECRQPCAPARAQAGARRACLPGCSGAGRHLLPGVLGVGGRRGQGVVVREELAGVEAGSCALVHEGGGEVRLGGVAAHLGGTQGDIPAMMGI